MYRSMVIKEMEKKRERGRDTEESLLQAAVSSITAFLEIGHGYKADGEEETQRSRDTEGALLQAAVSSITAFLEIGHGYKTDIKFVKREFVRLSP